MSRTTISSALLALGLLVGAATAIAMAVGFEPAPASGFLVKVALYKLTFIASLGLLAAGAIVGRWTRRADRTAVQSDVSGAGAPLADSGRHDAALLGEPGRHGVADVSARSGEPTPAPRRSSM